ncbi:hypothetical protein RN001_004649 [Aquatica leii]|uniref:Cytochrome P450 n=1 Tax=Aquatica leii TaxID=1421715 RepID=A0AAN7Q5Z8_9COLE|nr:hypothetical protein RN001_004649 [Aquatica leii]
MFSSGIINENFVTGAVIVLCFVVAYFKYSCNYWKRRGIPQIPVTYPFGNITKVFLRQQMLGDRIKEIYNLMKGHECVGIYFVNQPVLIPLSPNLIKNILTKDFQYFHDRGIYYDEENDPLSAHLFSLSGIKWRNLRNKFSPAFTSGKLKFMLETIVACGVQMKDVLEDMANASKEVEMKDIMARFTTDVIGSCAFGLECNTMKNPETEFRQMGRRAFTQTIPDMLRVISIYLIPRLVKPLGFGVFSRKVTNFFKQVVKDTMDYRENNNVSRKDFLQLLIQLKQKGYLDHDENINIETVPDGTVLTFEEAAAQAFIFFLAGFETTSATMSFAMFEMCVNSEIQNRAREEVINVMKKYNDQLTYESLTEMQYLDTVISETLRKYPPAPVYARKSTENYPIPFTNMVIEKDSHLLLPIWGLHRDPEFWPNPDKFDPERFNDENKCKIADYTYLPFGEGPRICIGQRFALIQIKVGLALILKNFLFCLNSKTPLPLKLEPKGIVITPVSGIWLDLKKIGDNCNYWKRRGIPQIPVTYPFGNITKVFLRQQMLGDRIKEIYNLMKGHECVGIYFVNQPVLIPLSPNLIKNILTKDFQYFHDRGIYYDEENDPLSAHLFSLSGIKWRNLRNKFSPAFTSGKLKFMLETIVSCGVQMKDVLEDMANASKEVEMKDIMARFTTDVIGSCAFGLECNTMNNPETEFRQMGRRAFTQTIPDMLRVISIYLIPRLVKPLGFGDTMDYRENNNVSRKDFLQLLIQLKQKGYLDHDENLNIETVPDGTVLTFEEAAAQAFIFFLAGFETTSATMSFAMFEMCVNSEIQNRAREEVINVMKKYNNQLTYESLTELQYLDTVISETLRKYPPAPVYARKSTENYPIPFTNMVIEKDSPILLPIWGLHRDPEFWPNPDKFDPERFNDENKCKIADYTYLPFGEGPRICIGQRFALIQIKVGLALILKNFLFCLNPKTPLPLKLEPKGIVITPVSGIWLDLKKIGTK